jgi:hypothetical protein
MGRFVEALEGWLSTWLVTTLCVGVAVGLALLGTALWHERGVRQLQALAGAHWTERARVYTETRGAVRRFRRWLVLGTLLLALPRTGHVQPGDVLRYCATVLVSSALLTYPIDAHWVRCASQGAQTPHTPSQAVKLTFVWSSATWITLIFVALAPARYDACGGAWALGFVFSMALGAGASTRLAWTLGWLAPAPVELQAAISRQAKLYRLKAPKAHVVSSPRVFASCVVWPGWLVLSSGALELLAVHELVALSTYQFRWLRLTWRAKAWLHARVSIYAVVPIACVPAFPEAPWAGVLLAVLATGYLRHALPPIDPFTRRPSRESSREPNPPDSRYPLALERARQANWEPMVYAEQSRSLYELRVEAGPPPDYPRPRPVSSRARDLAASFAAVLALLLGVGLHDWLDSFFRFH